MPLDDQTVRFAAPTSRPYKLYDALGLVLLVQPSGSKLWHHKYRMGGVEKKLSIGPYPAVSLRQAREDRDQARLLIRRGVDPSKEKQKKRAQQQLLAKQTFGMIAEEYLSRMALEKRAETTIAKARWLLSLMKRDLWSLPVGAISPAELLVPLRRVEAKENFETARRMRSLAGRIFRYAIATSRASSDPSALLRGALIAPKVKHHSAILCPKLFGKLLADIELYKGWPHTCLALRLLPHVFVRPCELRKARWSEVDLTGAVWTIPAERTKMRRQHKVPLSRQVLSYLLEANECADHDSLIFAALSDYRRPLSENTINGALRRMGYTGNQMTGHGFRATASTFLNESGRWSVDAIERALGHQDLRAVRRAYHRGEHWEERVRMAQWWSDRIDQLRMEHAQLRLL